MTEWVLQLQKLVLAISRLLSLHQGGTALVFLVEPTHPHDEDHENLNFFSETCPTTTADDDGVDFVHTAALCLWTSGVPVAGTTTTPPATCCADLTVAFLVVPLMLLL